MYLRQAEGQRDDLLPAKASKWQWQEEKMTTEIFGLLMPAAGVERGMCAAVRKGVGLGLGEGQAIHSQGGAGHRTEP